MLPADRSIRSNLVGLAAPWHRSTLAGLALPSLLRFPAPPVSPVFPVDRSVLSDQSTPASLEAPPLPTTPTNSATCPARALDSAPSAICRKIRSARRHRRGCKSLT